MNQITPGVYKHYKGNLYEVIGVARSSEDIHTQLVIYKQLYESKALDGTSLPKGTLWARPKEMFLETITMNDGTKMARFTRV